MHALRQLPRRSTRSPCVLTDGVILELPGSEIPRVYHDFVRTGDARTIAQVLKHNLYDLVTLADLLGRMFRAD